MNLTNAKEVLNSLRKYSTIVTKISNSTLIIENREITMIVY